jgi:3',5'-cyclic AMP phosphodiesterase CpdA
MANTFRIAHISDIHFRSDFPAYQWKHVKRVLHSHHPHAIAITGDFVESPWPLMLALAKRELLELQDELDVPVITIPGNHDVAFLGFIPIWPLTRLYPAIFAKQNEEWIRSVIPTFESFYSAGFLKRLAWRPLIYGKLLWRWGTGRLRAPQHRDALHIPEATIPLSIVGLDSNRSLLLAAGRVSAAQINAFGSYAADLEDPAKGITSALLPRIALIHHHLVPIPYTRRESSGNESFLVLRNAGTVLRELWNHDFDLVLHGHRHYSSFSRITFEQNELEGRELAVLSAASPTTTEPEAGSNSFHLVDVHANGRIRTRRIQFGTEMTVHSASSAEQWFDALSFKAVKERNFRRLVKIMNHSLDELSRSLSIDTNGVSLETIRIKDMTVRPGGTLRERSFRTTVDRGSIHNNNYRKLRDAGLWTSGCLLTIPKAQPDPKVAEATLIFNPPLENGRKASFGVEYQGANSFAMSNWELATFPPDGKITGLQQGPVGLQQEAHLARVRFPIRQLRMALELPSSLREPKPYVVCSAPWNYPELSVDGHGDLSAPPKAPEGKSTWLQDGDVSDYEKQFLRQLAENVWEWTIDYPLVGYRYEIRWHVEDVREEKIDVPQAGQTCAYRKCLMNYARRAYGPDRPPIQSSVREQIMRRLLEPVHRLAPNFIGSDENFRVSLFVFDDESHDLVLVEEAQKGDSLLATDAMDKPLRVPFGEGIAGLSFKRCSGLSYYAQAANSQGFAAQLFREATANNLRAIVGVPLLHPRAWAYAEDKLARGEVVTWADLPSVRQAIGVVTFASDSDASGLSIFQQGAESIPLFKKIQGIVSSESTNLLNMILKEAS